MRSKPVELVFVTLCQFLERRNPSPVYSARALLALCGIFNAFTGLVLLKKWHGPTLELPERWSWPACAAAVFLAYWLCYGLTRHVPPPARIRLGPAAKRTGGWLAAGYVALSYVALSAALWSITVD